MKSILCINPKGAGDLHELRARRLTRDLNADITFYNVDRRMSYPAATRALSAVVRSRHWDLIYQESTGIIGGSNLIQAAQTRQQRFIVSSGDPIGGFFRVTRGPAVGAFFDAYERLLYRNCAGFVGWTPYLTGAALTLGAKRAVTVEGAADLETFRAYPAVERKAAKERFGLDPGHLVCGVVGSLNWTPRQSYCYGLELVETLKLLKRTDVSLLIVGDGSGRKILEERVPNALRPRVVFTGRLPEADVVRAMNAMDIGFITQTLDQLGNFRLTTKLPEYLACGLPVAMSPVPGFYDYAAPAGWALPARHPASAEFHQACAGWLENLDRDEIEGKAQQARPTAEKYFDYNILSQRFKLFVEDLLASS
jgi:hypothetical protein